MNEEKIEKILEVDIKFQTNHGRKSKIRLANFSNEDIAFLTNWNNDKQKYKINLTIECDDYSYKLL